MASETLKPCPCCRASAHLLGPSPATGHTAYKVMCVSRLCLLSAGPFATEAEAIAAWNRRAPQEGGET